jgi:FkbM family methyltransferase
MNPGLILMSLRRVRNTLRQCGIDVSLATPGLADFIAERRIDLVYDVGANTGQFATSLRTGGYKGDIVSFEPIKSVFETLARNSRSDAKWMVHNCGLGSVKGEAKINVSRDTVYSSILSEDEFALEHNPWAAVERTEEIRIDTLDAVSVGATANVLVKIDTQGFERQVLEGGTKTIQQAVGVLMELPIMHLYKGTWEFHEALAHMMSIGFVPSQITPVSFEKTSLIEVNCLFRRPCTKESRHGRQA